MDRKTPHNLSIAVWWAMFSVMVSQCKNMCLIRRFDRKLFLENLATYNIDVLYLRLTVCLPLYSLCLWNIGSIRFIRSLCSRRILKALKLLVWTRSEDLIRRTNKNVHANFVRIEILLVKSLLWSLICSTFAVHMNVQMFLTFLLISDVVFSYNLFL